ncbi:hypothetical protein PC117_g23514 [Phytophthora cactorum]|uniref:Uncharacterized protein n=1 Tax=Phytophthora cactorum TaxID=29920 RepID=A0A8T1B404_9STRA|nr:hypothetical protein PC117_g23514 [Phytophthora cactorum]
MSIHGWSGKGHGDDMGEGPGGWVPPLETETPSLVEIYAEEEEARAADEARGEVEESAPAGEGQGGEMERGTLRSAGQGARATRRKRHEAKKATPRGREQFNGFLEQLARQPAPSEGPSQGPGTTVGVPAGAATTTTTRPRQGVTISMDPSRPSLAPVERTRHEVPLVTPVYATPDRPNRSSGGVSTSGPGNYVGRRSRNGSGAVAGLHASGYT